MQITHWKAAPSTPLNAGWTIEKLGRNDRAPAAPAADFKQCCLRSGRFDGGERKYYVGD
jgi:uncharacterized protein YecA (UPF0149 family)